MRFFYIRDIRIFDNPSHKFSYSVKIIDRKLSFGIFNKNKIKSDNEVIRFDMGAKIKDPYIFEYKIYRWNSRLIKFGANLLKKILSP